MPCGKSFALARDITEIDKAIRDVDQLWRGIRSKAGDFHAAALVGHELTHRQSLRRLRRVPPYRSDRQAKHVDGDLDVEVRLARAIIKVLSSFCTTRKPLRSSTTESPVVAQRRHPRRCRRKLETNDHRLKDRSNLL